MPLNKVDISMIEDIAAPGEAGKVLASDGTNWVSADAGELSLPTAGVDGQVMTSDGTNWASEAMPVELPAAGADGQVLTSDGTGWVSEVVPVELPVAGADGQVLTSDGTGWVSEAIPPNPHVHDPGQVIEDIVLKDYGETTNVIGSIGGGTQDIDLELGNSVSATVDTAETTFTFSNPSAAPLGCGFTLILTNGLSQTVNWPASVAWGGGGLFGGAPTLTTAGVDILTFWTIDGGTIWHGFAASLDSS